MSINDIPEKIEGSYYVDEDGAVIRVLYLDITNVTCIYAEETQLKSRLLATHVFLTKIILGKILVL